MSTSTDLSRRTMLAGTAALTPALTIFPGPAFAFTGPDAELPLPGLAVQARAAAENAS